MKELFQVIIKFIKQNPFVKNVLLFAVIILGFHFFYRAWVHWFHWWPIRDFMMYIRGEMSTLVFEQSLWFDRHVLGMEIVSQDQTMIFPACGYITINASCSGFKQIMQFVVLMLIFPGPWKHKLWFIPMGIIIVHLTNLFRIVGLSVITENWVEYWHFSHDNLFRPFFYVVMFFLWVWWVEKFLEKPEPAKQ